MVEISEDFRDRDFDGERLRVFLEDFAKGVLLFPVHDAEEHGNDVAMIHAAALQHGRGVPEAYNQFLRDFLRTIGDNLKGDTGAVFLHQVRTDGRIEEAVENAKENRFDLFSVDEIAGAGNEAIQPKRHAEEPDRRIFVPNDGGDKIDTAGIGAATAENVVDVAHDDSADDGTEKRTGTGIGGIGERLDAKGFRGKEADRNEANEDEATD